MTDHITKLKKEEARQATTNAKIKRLLAINLTAFVVLMLCLLVFWWSKPAQPGPTAVETSNQPTNQVVINNNNNPSNQPNPFPTHIQIVHFTNIIPEAIGHRYQHNTQIISPVPCGRTNVCAFVIPPMQTDANYCITYRYYSDYKCIPVNPHQNYVEINVTE